MLRGGWPLLLLWVGLGLAAAATAAAREGDGEDEVVLPPIELAFERIRDRLARKMPGFEQKGLGVFHDSDGLAAVRPGGEFLPLSDGYQSWPNYYRAPTAVGAVWVPMPPRAEHRVNRAGDDRQWRSGEIRVRLRQRADLFDKLLDFNEAVAGENLEDRELETEFRRAKTDFDEAGRLDRFDLWWRMLRTEPGEMRGGFPFGRRLLALYLLYRKSLWPVPVQPYRNRHVRAFISEPYEDERLFANGGGAETWWTVDAWVAPAIGDPLVHLRFSERENFDRELTHAIVLRQVAGIRFEPAAGR